MLIDSHAHLDDLRYDTDRNEVLQRAEAAGIEAIVTIGCDLATSQAAVALAHAHPNIFATIGVHPHEAKEIGEGWYESFRSFARQPKVVAYAKSGWTIIMTILHGRSNANGFVSRFTLHANWPFLLSFTRVKPRKIP